MKGKKKQTQTFFLKEPATPLLGVVGEMVSAILQTFISTSEDRVEWGMRLPNEGQYFLARMHLGALIITNGS